MKNKKEILKAALINASKNNRANNADVILTMMVRCRRKMAGI